MKRAALIIAALAATLLTATPAQATHLFCTQHVEPVELYTYRLDADTIQLQTISPVNGSAHFYMDTDTAHSQAIVNSPANTFAYAYITARQGHNFWVKNASTSWDAGVCISPTRWHS